MVQHFHVTLIQEQRVKKMLVNLRGIFLKQVLSKIFGRLNMNRISGNIEKIDLSQAGSRTNRGPADQTFLLRASIDHSKYLNRPLYIVLYDYSQCFDSLWLDDCLLSLWKLGIQSEILYLIKEMNRECNIVIKTPVGLTEEFTVTNIVQQGSVSGGILCSASTGELAGEITTGGTQIGLATIRNLTFVDDIATVNNKTKDVYKSHDQVTWFSMKKRLTLNCPKCVILPVNLKTSDVVPRLTIGEAIIKDKDVATYLGDQFNKKGTNVDLVEERVKKGQCCIINCMSLCSDVTLGFHGVETLLLLYGSLFVQVVLFNAQAWSNFTQTDLKALQTIQLKYLKRMLHAPSSTSNAITFLETGVLPMSYKIHVRQLTFLHHILTLSNNDPVKFTYQQQLLYNAPNWANETQNLRQKYGLTLTDMEISKKSKGSWKRLVKCQVRQYALDQLNKEASGKKLCRNLCPYLELTKQEYFTKLSPKFARKIFHLRTGTIDLRGVRDYKYGVNKTCRLCLTEIETVDHVVNKCNVLGWTHEINDIYTRNSEELKEVAKRCIIFDEKVEKLNNETT